MMNLMNVKIVLTNVRNVPNLPMIVILVLETEKEMTVPVPLIITMMVLMLIAHNVQTDVHFVTVVKFVPIVKLTE